MLALPFCYLGFVGTLPTPLVTPLRGRAALVVLAGLAAGAMPKVAPTTDYLAFRKLKVYRAAFESLYADEVISDKERAMLDRLRVKLAILPGDAIAVERDVRGERVAAGAA